jgi:cytochrome c oxidase subunit 4
MTSSGTVAPKERAHAKVSTYLAIWGVLLVLTGLTVAVAEVDFGPWNLAIAMTIATIKVVLVAAFFMHLRYERTGIYLGFALIGLATLGIFIALTFTDIGVRF